MMPSLAQTGVPTLPATPRPGTLPRAQTDQGVVLWAIVGVVLLVAIAALVIKMKRDG